MELHVRALVPGVGAGAMKFGIATGASRGLDCSFVAGRAAAGATGALSAFALVGLLLFVRRRATSYFAITRSVVKVKPLE